ncbi:uncharacterized protein At5g50100, chloroplastic-like [Pecten maximus]|uniref:uncharacterized protein At5g50100, chloroplastic-like n=1 Tax=Pecten maximus TaxID=6579 RepID=UPI001458B8BA|nr:uncharacterized protein At5g50100, chloroplastic-like [Pecten maximus]
MTSFSLLNILKHSSLNKLISPGRVLGGRPVLTISQQRRSSSSIKPNHKVLYDGNCPICVKEVNLLQRANNGSVKFVDITKGRYNPADHQGIQYEDAMGALHVISPDKKLFVGMDGTRELYRALGLGWMVSFTELPGVKSVADNAYRWFALNRYWLTGRLGESKEEEDCDSGRCKIPNNGQRKR